METPRNHTETAALIKLRVSVSLTGVNFKHPGIQLQSGNCMSSFVFGSCMKDDELKPETVKGQKTRMALITLVGFLTAAAYKMHSPLMTQYTEQIYTQQVYGNDSLDVQVSKTPCVDNSTTDPRKDKVQDLSADYLSRLNLVSGGIAIVVNLFLGAYSDTLGRKFVLLLPTVGTFLRNATAPVIIHWDLGLPAMYVGYVLDGMCGSISGVLLGLYVYTSDITRSDTQRTMGYFYPSLAACLLNLACILIIAVLLPETLPRDRKRFVSPLASFKHLIGTFIARDNAYRQALLLLSLVAFLISTLPTMSVSSVENLFFMNEPFCWDAIQIGIFGTIWDGSSLVASLTIIKILQKILSTPLLIIVGSLSETGEMVVLGFARNRLMVYLVPVAGILRKMFYPAIRSFMSRLVPQNRQGALFAGIAVVESVCACLGPYTFLNIYKLTMSYMAGFVFLTVAGCNFVDSREISVVPVKDQKTRMALITLVGLLVAAAKKLFDPLMTQYTYQVYTQQVYGNDSHHVQVTRQPCVDTNSSNSSVDPRVEQVQDLSADFLSRLNLVSGGLGIVINLFLGAYSDTLGRKFGLLLPMIGTFLRYVAAPVIIHWDLGLDFMFAGYIVDGLCGSLSETAIGMGQTALNVVGGVFMEDTEGEEAGVPLENPRRSARMNGATYKKEDFFAPSYFYPSLVACLLILVMNLYFMDQPICWDAIHIGIYMTVFDGSSLIVSLATINLLQKIFSTPLLAAIGALSEAGELVMLGLVHTDLLIYLVPLVGLLRKLMYAAMRSFLSRLVPQDRKGALFAGIAVVESVCYCLGTFTFMNIYKVTMSFMKGFVFLTIAGSHVAVAIIFM
nr:hypothetical protein BaRGS_002518 [Batillaria attramentaria]